MHKLIYAVASVALAAPFASAQSCFDRKIQITSAQPASGSVTDCGVPTETNKLTINTQYPHSIVHQYKSYTMTTGASSWVESGTVSPTPQTLEAKTACGWFDGTRFVGPYAETCRPTDVPVPPNWQSGGPGPGTYTWSFNYRDGRQETQYGKCIEGPQRVGLVSATSACTCSGPAPVCPGGASPECSNGAWQCPNGVVGCIPPPPPMYCGTGEIIVCQAGGTWTCAPPPNNSPIIIDTTGDGFHLTGIEQGVQFAFFPNQAPITLSWTNSAYGNGFLALDRNGNGRIDDGTELFGNLTEQPVSLTPNGFAALKVFDLIENGGNGNDVIDAGDSVFERLVVWVDRNHNGSSESSELLSLREMKIRIIWLDYVETPYVDEFGNEFRYKSKIIDNAGREHRTLYDVFLKTRY